jgi:RecB family exonuclease
MPTPTVISGTIDALEDALARAVRDARLGDPLAPVTVLIGHVLLRPYLRRALAMRGVAQINVRFVRPNELAGQMAAVAQDARPRFVPGVERLLVRDIAGQAVGYFREVAGRDGFSAALLRLFRELELGGFSAASFAAALGDVAGDGKPAQLRDLYELYTQRRSGFASITDQYDDAMGVAFEGPLLVHGLWSPTKRQRDLIAHIAGTSDVTVFLPASGFPADEAHSAFRGALEAMGATIRMPAAASADEATRFDRALAPAIAGRDVELTSAPDTVREVWEVARTCLAWARDGIAFHEMAVAYRHRDPYRDLVEEVFDEAKIPVYIHDGRLLSAHPLGRRLLMLLDLAAHHETFGRADVMEFLTETEIPETTRERYARVRTSEWETYTRDAGVVEGIAQWRQRLGRLSRQKREEAKHEGREWLADVADRIDDLSRFSSDLHEALAARPDEATWDEHLAFLRSLAGVYAEGTAPIIDALADVRALAAVRERATFEEFCRAVRDDLDGRDTSRVLGEPVRLFGRQGVAVIDASSLRHLRFRAVALLGVAERAWPPPSRPDPLLLEHERARINAAGEGELPMRTQPDVEPLGVLLAAQAAKDKLAISFARADAGRSGKYLPSYFFRAVVEALEGRTLTLGEIERSAHVRRVEAGRLATADVERSLSTAEYDRGLVRAAYEGSARGAVGALSSVSPSFGRAVAARRGRWSQNLTPYDGVILDAERAAEVRAQSPFARGSPVSPSRLEKYAGCPYQYFLAHTIGIRRIDEPEEIERIDHLQRGSLIHDILQRFLERIGRSDPPRHERRDAHIAILLDVSREVGADYEDRGVTGKPLYWRMDKRRIDDDLVRWYDAEAADTSGLTPGAFEVRFGPSYGGLGDEDKTLSRDEPIELSIDGRPIRVQGRIDRIDWDGEGTRFRVIDYKTGKFRQRGVLDGGKALQLPIYLLAAAELLNLPREAGESQYFHCTSGGGYRRHVIAGTALRDASDDFDRVLTTIADGVDGGYFAPNPETERCRYCDYRTVCDKKIERIAGRKAGDARSKAFIAMSDIT